MHFTDILAKFFSLFPTYQERVTMWTPAGRHTIHLDLKDRRKLEFVYHSDTDWTLHSYK
jgi:hypothetical protein